MFRHTRKQFVGCSEAPHIRLFFFLLLFFFFSELLRKAVGASLSGKDCHLNVCFTISNTRFKIDDTATEKKNILTILHSRHDNTI